MDLAASASATALTSTRPSLVMVRAIAAARRDDAVAVATATEWAASVSYAQGRSGSWGYLARVPWRGYYRWYAATRLNAAR